MRIVTDSAAEMSPQELEMLAITAAPLYINFPEGEVESGDITPDEFYDRLQAMYPAIPTTAQPSSGIFSKIYQRIAESDKEILSVHISSGLSGTLNSASVGAEHAGPDCRVSLWDTFTLSGGERFQVLAAALASRAGWTLASIQQKLAEIRNQTEVTFTLDTLEYLARGGRIGRIQALAGMLLNVKPVIHVDHKDGKYSVVAKSRTSARALTAITDHMLALYDQTPVWVAVQHGCVVDRARALANQLSERLTVAKLEFVRVSPVLGVHTGPTVVGASIVPMQLMSDLIPSQG